MNKRFRKLINDLHLWLGLGSGIVLFIVCLTGTIYTFRTEIETFFNKDTYYFKVDDTAKQPAIDSLIQLIEKQEKTSVAGFSIPTEKNKVWTFSLKPEKGKGEKANARGKQILVNPYTGHIVGGTQTSSGKFFLTMMKLHRWLLLEQQTGRIIVGVSTLIFTFLLLSGLILWLPKKLKYWKQGFVILFSARWKRINHDLHNVLGFYSFLVILMMALTGLCWSFDWYKNGASQLLGAPVLQRGGGKPITSNNLSGTGVAVSTVLTVADNALPQKGETRINFPEDSIGVFTVIKNNEAAFNVSATDKVSIDQYSAAILNVEKFSEKQLGAKIAASIKPIHTGEIFGLFSKIIYFICCLIATSLPVTGTLIWWNKLKKK
ncbi:MAG: PepSY-associated TM helix domain-containing protein [Niabella sp.]